MQRKFFEGTIPSSFTHLKGPKVLDLSHNNFFREFPSFLSDLSLFKCSIFRLICFEGEVPNKGVFRNTSAYSVVGDKKLCGGV